MGAGFYAMIAASILLYKIAEIDKKAGWIWFGINLCVAMALGRFFGLTVTIAIVGFLLTFCGMFLLNVIKPRKPE